MAQTTKGCCPKCKTPFRVGALPTQNERLRNDRTGVIDLGDSPPETMSCPKCEVKLRVVVVRMGAFFSVD